MTPYEGSKPYIFISYSHKDTDAVLSVIESLEKKGFRVWFDAGVEAGSEWPEYIASHLRKSACVLAFISPNFVASLNCRRELTFAQDLNVPMLNVYLTEVDLPDGLRMQLGLNQCLFRNKFDSAKAFEEALCRADMLKSCQEGAMEPSKEPQTADLNISAAEEVVKESYAAHKGLKSALTWLTSIIQLSYCYTGIVAIDHVTKHAGGGFAQFLWMILPLSITTLLSLILFRTLGRPLTKKEKDDASSGTAFCWFVGFLVAIIGGCFYIHADAGVFMKILTVIGLHLLPGLISLITIGYLDE